MHRGFGLACGAVFLAMGCGGSPTVPRASSQAGPSSVVVQALGAPPGSPTPTPWHTGEESGDFRIHPDPPEGAAPLTVTLNMCHGTTGELHYHVHWGDGTEDQGTCRLTHVYARGVFAATACVWDRIPADWPGSCETFTVRATSSNPTDLFCHSIHASIARDIVVSCPSGVTEFCDTSPIVATNPTQARRACDACLGGACRPIEDQGISAFAFFGDFSGVTPGAIFWYGSGTTLGCFAAPSVIRAGSITSICNDVTGRWAP